MVYFIIYVIIGAVIGLLTWFWNSSKYSERINEGGILIYLIGCIFLWPAVFVATTMDMCVYIWNKINIFKI